MKEKFAFVILHYITIEDTIKCVDSILKRYNDVDIVIVDNFSNNGTYEQLKNIYEQNSKIHIISSDKNLGFANGNNLGFKYAKETLKSDFIIMINNDTYLIQNDFCELISEEYKISSFAILGPRILMNGNKISDYSDRPETLEYVKKKIRSLKIRKIYNNLYLYKIYDVGINFGKLLKKHLKKLFKMKPDYIADTSIRKENVVLQGCALIFSKEYINKFDGIDNRTFLFNEEQLLYLRAKDNNLKTVYNPYIMIYHNENSSTNKSTTSLRKKMKFVLDNELKSTNILLEELKKRSK